MMTTDKAAADTQLQLKYYDLLIDLYKFYFDGAFRANVFYYAAVGGILTYYFSHREDPLMKGALAFPLLMSFGLAVVFWYGARLASVLRDEVIHTSKRLGLAAFPETSVLVAFLRA